MSDMNIDTNPRSIIFVSVDAEPVEMTIALGDVVSLYDEGRLIVCRVHEVSGNNLIGKVMSSDNPIKYPDDSNVPFDNANVFGVFKARHQVDLESDLEIASPRHRQ
jgi:hypothetical protein